MWYKTSSFIKSSIHSSYFSIIDPPCVCLWKPPRIAGAVLTQAQSGISSPLIFLCVRRLAKAGEGGLARSSCSPTALSLPAAQSLQVSRLSSICKSRLGLLCSSPLLQGPSSLATASTDSLDWLRWKRILVVRHEASPKESILGKEAGCAGLERLLPSCARDSRSASCLCLGFSF